MADHQDPLLPFVQTLLRDEEVPEHSAPESPTIHNVAKEGDLAALQGLLEKHKELNGEIEDLLNCRDQMGNLPLFYAAAGGHLAVVEFLFEKTMTMGKVYYYCCLYF